MTREPSQPSGEPNWVVAQQLAREEVRRPVGCAISHGPGGPWRDGIQVRRRQHRTGPQEVVPRRLAKAPIETTFESTAKNAGAQLAAGPAFGLVRLAVAAGFEPAEGCPHALSSSAAGGSDPFGWVWSRLEPRLGSPLRTPLNLHE
mgnify:CR=1 FL=1